MKTILVAVESVQQTLIEIEVDDDVADVAAQNILHSDAHAIMSGREPTWTRPQLRIVTTEVRS